MKTEYYPNGLIITQQNGILTAQWKPTNETTKQQH